jgi:hypothetical protein
VWINLAHNMNRGQVHANKVTTVFHKRLEIYWLAKRLLVSREGLCSMGLVT